VRAAEARLRSLAGSRVELAGESSRELLRQAQELTVRARPTASSSTFRAASGESVGEGQLVASVSDPDRRRVRIRVDQPICRASRRGSGSWSPSTVCRNAAGTGA
jgi:hypothetical protein